MEWEKVISGKRLGMEMLYEESNEDRSNFQRDYDRLIFSPSFRRLQNKTQVFPLPGAVFVHNRLTHSLEVASVGRSLATAACISLKEKYAGQAWIDKLESLDDIVAAACLAHDMGNPPYGHSGEEAIRSFFREGKGRSLHVGLYGLIIVVEIKTSVCIKQTFFHTIVKIQTGESSSISKCASFDIDTDRGVKQLYSSYVNNPNPEVRHKSEIHYGTTLLEIRDDSQTLSGEYWTSRKTTGSVTLNKCK